MKTLAPNIYLNTCNLCLSLPVQTPGKPSFPYFKVYYLPRQCVLAELSQRTCDVESPRLDGARKIRRPGPQPPESEDWGRPPRVGEDGILPYRLALATILAVKWAS
ncbi:hypothetical protein THAOC_20106, partial [Thalassiosira oceanica]